jgi:Uma2 family endonuclease
MGIQTSPSVPLDDIEYPDSDGQPMAENTLQFLWITYLKENFEFLFRDRDDVFVAGDLLWYPVEGNNVLRAAPDTMIAFGRPKGRRGSYMQWRENNVSPQVVWEVLSPGNRAGELREKLEFYELYGVEEYYQYDPDNGELRGWLRERERLRPIAEIRGWISPRTGVRLDLEGEDLVVATADGKEFVHDAEVRARSVEDSEARQVAEARAAQERREKEAAEVRAAQERREKEAAEVRAAQERRNKEAAEARAAQERRDKQIANDRAERLAAKLRAHGIDPDAE